MSFFVFLYKLSTFLHGIYSKYAINSPTIKGISTSIKFLIHAPIAEKLSRQIEEITGYETRHMVLGHLQRGGEPCVADILLGARLGDYALNLLADDRSGYIVGAHENVLIKTRFPKIREPRILDIEDNDIARTARDMGICFGV